MMTRYDTDLLALPETARMHAVDCAALGLRFPVRPAGRPNPSPEAGTRPESAPVVAWQ